MLEMSEELSRYHFLCLHGSVVTFTPRQWEAVQKRMHKNFRFEIVSDPILIRLMKSPSIPEIEKGNLFHHTYYTTYILQQNKIDGNFY